MSLITMSIEDVNWIELAYDRAQCRAFILAVFKLTILPPVMTDAIQQVTYFVIPKSKTHQNYVRHTFITS
jgi:hypothetical protein